MRRIWNVVVFERDGFNERQIGLRETRTVFVFLSGLTHLGTPILLARSASLLAFWWTVVSVAPFQLREEIVHEVARAAYTQAGRRDKPRRFAIAQEKKRPLLAQRAAR